MVVYFRQWRYRSEIWINRPNQTYYYQLPLTVPYFVGMDKNFNDIRFSTIDGVSLFYCVESFTPGVSANVLVRVSPGAGKILMYFGNDSAVSESNRQKTYDFWDDLSSGSMSNFTGVNVSVVSDGAGGYVAELTSTNTTSSYITTKYCYGTNQLYSVDFMIKSVGSTNLIGYSFSARGTYPRPWINQQLSGTGGSGTAIDINGSYYGVARPVYELDTWYRLTFRSGLTDSEMKIIKVSDGTVIYTGSLTYGQSAVNGVWQARVNNYGGKMWCKNFVVQNFVAPTTIGTIKKPKFNRDLLYTFGNAIRADATLGLHPSFSLSQTPITAGTTLGLHPKYAEVMPPIDAGNAEIWIHNRVNIASFINPYEAEIRHTQDYSSASKLNPITPSSIGFSPAVLQMDKISLSSNLGVTPGGGQTKGKMRIESEIINRGRYRSKSTFSVEGGQLGNISAYMNLERYSFNTDLGLGGTFQGKKDFIGIHTGIEFSKRLRFTFERTIIQTPGQLKVKPGVMYKSPFPLLESSLGLTPQAWPIKKKWFLIDYNVKSVEISKTISDSLWTLQADFAGTDRPKEFEGLNHSQVDYQGDVQHLFTGVCPDSSPTLSNTDANSTITAYDYGYYLSKQYLTDESFEINLQGDRTSWRDWIIYLLKGTGITPYKIAYADMPDVTFSFNGKTTKRQAIDAISNYCNCIFEVAYFNHGTATSPIWVTGAYWVKIGDLDSFTQGLDLPNSITFSWPNKYFLTMPTVSANPEEKINRVRVRGTDGTNTFSCTVETAEVTNGDDIARELYEDQEDNKALVSQDAVNSRASELLAYYENPPYQVTARMIKRFDLRLYQKIRFDSTFPDELSSLTDGSKGGVTWLRITEIMYHCEPGNEYVEFKAISDTETAVLFAAQGEGSYTLLDNIETVSQLL